MSNVSVSEIIDQLIIIAKVWEANGQQTDGPEEVQFSLLLKKLGTATGTDYDGAMQILLNSQGEVAA